MAVFESLAHISSELDLVNTVLVSAGESPLPSNTVLENQTAFDILTAIDLIKKVLREVQLEPWRFNTEDGVRFDPSDEFVFTNPDSTTTAVNIFPDPGQSFISWELTPCEDNRELDVLVKMSEQYTVSAATVPVLWDRRNHRDGPEKEKHPAIYLDVQRMIPFSKFPEVARSYVGIVASRRFCQKTLGSAEKGQFTQQDELSALRLLKREQGRPRKYNFLNNLETLETMGRPVVSYAYERRLFNK